MPTDTTHTSDHPSSVPFRERLTCTIADAAVVTGLGRTSLYQLIEDGRLDTVSIAVRCGDRGRRLVRVRSLLALLGEDPS